MGRTLFCGLPAFTLESLEDFGCVSRDIYFGGLKVLSGLAWGHI